MSIKENIENLIEERKLYSVKGLDKTDIHRRKEYKNKQQNLNYKIKKLKEKLPNEILEEALTETETFTETEVKEATEMAGGILQSLGLVNLFAKSEDTVEEPSGDNLRSRIDMKMKLDPELAKLKPLNLPDVSKMTSAQIKRRSDTIDSHEKQQLSLSMGNTLKAFTVGGTKYATGIDIADEIRDNAAYTRSLGKIIPYDTLVEDRYAPYVFIMLHISAMMSAWFKEKEKQKLLKPKEINNNTSISDV